MAIAKTWIGGGNNRASNSSDWSPSGAPLPGQELDIKVGTINVSGNDLRGDPLTLAYSGLDSPAITINATNATLGLAGGLYCNASVTVNVSGQLRLTANVAGIAGKMAFIGGSVDLVGTSVFHGGVTFNSNIVGTGTIDALPTSYVCGPTLFNGSVGPGVTVALGDGGKGNPLIEIAHPSQFTATLSMPSHNQDFTSVLFEGLTVTRADLAGSTLQLWNGSTLVDQTRMAGDLANLAVTQRSNGVMLATYYDGHPTAGNLLAPVTS